jgi:hypothetical protein
MTTSKLTKDALDKKKAKNERVGQIPYGWKLVDKTNLVKIPEEQKVLSRMRRLRKQGLSYRQICDILTNENIPTKKGGEWHYQSVRKMCGIWKPGTVYGLINGRR